MQKEQLIQLEKALPSRVHISILPGTTVQMTLEEWKDADSPYIWKKNRTFHLNTNPLTFIMVAEELAYGLIALFVDNQLTDVVSDDFLNYNNQLIILGPAYTNYSLKVFEVLPESPVI